MAQAQSALDRAEGAARLSDHLPAGRKLKEMWSELDWSRPWVACSPACKELLMCGADPTGHAAVGCRKTSAGASVRCHDFASHALSCKPMKD